MQRLITTGFRFCLEFSTQFSWHCVKCLFKKSRKTGLLQWIIASAVNPSFCHLALLDRKLFKEKPSDDYYPKGITFKVDHSDEQLELIHPYVNEYCLSKHSLGNLLNSASAFLKFWSLCTIWAKNFCIIFPYSSSQYAEKSSTLFMVKFYAARRIFHWKY